MASNSADSGHDGFLHGPRSQLSAVLAGASQRTPRRRVPTIRPRPLVQRHGHREHARDDDGP
jgi:hypothetical protein